MERNTTVSLDNYFEQFVEKSLSEDKYNNASKTIQTGLFSSEEDNNRIKVLKNAIQEGIDSGIAENFDPKKHLQSLKAKQKKNGKVFSL